MYVVWVLAAAIFFTAGMTRLSPTLLFFLSFAVGAAFQALALRYAELGVAYVVVLGLEAVFAVVLGVLVFSEQMSALKCGGVIAVVLGIVLLHLGETDSPGETVSTASQASDAPMN
jgi:multidrug transporter EmrE-like cation transporter